MAKNPALTALLDSLAEHIGLHPENKAVGKCVQCGEEALPRCTTEAGRRDVEIHGMCEMCYDAMWVDKENPEDPEEDLEEPES